MQALPQRTKLPHDAPAWVGTGATYFVTLCCQPRGADQLCQESVANGLFEAASFRQRTGRWYLHLLLLMPDHLHALVGFSIAEEMRKVISLFKENTAKRLPIQWQRDFFDHRLRAEESFDEKANYIRMNPVRRGLVERSDDWPWVWEAENQPSGGPSGSALPEK